MMFGLFLSYDFVLFCQFIVLYFVNTFVSILDTRYIEFVIMIILTLGTRCSYFIRIKVIAFKDDG